MPGILFGMRGTSCPIVPCGLSPPGQEDQAVIGAALVDTGASHVVADPAFIERAGLPQLGTTNHTVVGEPTRTRRTFSATAIFTGLRALPPHNLYTYSVRDAVIVEEHLVGYDFILGWDVLYQIEMQFGRDGAFLLRLP